MEQDYYLRLQDVKKRIYQETKKMMHLELVFRHNTRLWILQQLRNEDWWTTTGCEVGRGCVGNSIHTVDWISAECRMVCRRYSNASYRVEYTLNDWSHYISIQLIGEPVPGTIQDEFYKNQSGSEERRRKRRESSAVLAREMSEKLARFEALDQPYIHEQARKLLFEALDAEHAYSEAGISMSWNHEKSKPLAKAEIQRICREELSKNGYEYHMKEEHHMFVVNITSSQLVTS